MRVQTAACSLIPYKEIIRFFLYMVIRLTTETYIFFFSSFSDSFDPVMDIVFSFLFPTFSFSCESFSLLSGYHPYAVISAFWWSSNIPSSGLSVRPSIFCSCYVARPAPFLFGYLLHYILYFCFFPYHSFLLLYLNVIHDILLYLDLCVVPSFSLFCW